jgi:phage pi2 protein 07
MKINFTKKEYRFLSDIIHIADWIMNSHSVEQRKETEEHEAVFQKLLSFAKEMGYEDLIECVKGNGKYYPTHKFENESVAHQFIDEFQEDIFWEELISRLARRDLLKEKQVGSVAELSDDEWISGMTNAEEKWVKEFEEFDLDRISVNQSFKDVVH